jgi:hypothetical protein
MKEYLLLIRNKGDHWGALSPQQQQKHIQKASNYIGKLTQEGRIKNAQPLTMNGLMLESKNGVFKDGPFIESKEVIGGFFHILANDLNEALEIAKANPIFEETNARIEIREIMRAEGSN